MTLTMNLYGEEKGPTTLLQTKEEGQALLKKENQRQIQFQVPQLPW